jgi:hypothetical protein
MLVEIARTLILSSLAVSNDDDNRSLIACCGNNCRKCSIHPEWHPRH